MAQAPSFVGWLRKQNTTGSWIYIYIWHKRSFPCLWLASCCNIYAYIFSYIPTACQYTIVRSPHVHLWPLYNIRGHVIKYIVQTYSLCYVSLWQDALAYTQLYGYCECPRTMTWAWDHSVIWIHVWCGEWELFQYLSWTHNCVFSCCEVHLSL